MKKLLLILLIGCLTGCFYNPRSPSQNVTVNVINNSQKEQKRFYYVRVVKFNYDPLVQQYQGQMLAGRFFDLMPRKSRAIFRDNYTSNFLTYTWDRNYDFHHYPPYLMVFVGGCNQDAMSPTTVPYYPNGGDTTVTYTFYTTAGGRTACSISKS